MSATWNEPTPSGHVYVPPTDYASLRKRLDDYVQGEVEQWDDAERVPAPTWGMVSIALQHAEEQKVRADSHASDLVGLGPLAEMLPQFVANARPLKPSIIRTIPMDDLLARPPSAAETLLAEIVGQAHGRGWNPVELSYENDLTYNEIRIIARPVPQQ